MVITRLFRDPGDAVRAVEMLKEKGFTEKEVSVLALNKGGLSGLLPGTVVELSEAESVLVRGPLVDALSQAARSDGLEAALTQALEVIEEKAKYYRFALSVGGVLVSVHTEDEARAPVARRVLKEAETVPQPQPAMETSPGFLAASRMCTTNPIDAPMSGDFRRY
jgi:hypothetical protein